MTHRQAVMICGHGSRDQAAVAEFNTLAGHLSRRFPQFDVESGFLEFARPVIRDGLEKLKNDEIAAIVATTGKPSPVLGALKASDGYRILPIPFNASNMAACMVATMRCACGDGMRGATMSMAF